MSFRILPPVISNTSQNASAVPSVRLATTDAWSCGRARDFHVAAAIVVAARSAWPVVPEAVSRFFKVFCLSFQDVAPQDSPLSTFTEETPMRPDTTRSSWGSVAVAALAVLAMSLTWACDSQPPMSPTPLPGGPGSVAGPSPAPSPTDSSPPQPSPTRYHVSGRVTDEAGSPIAGALVAVNHGRVQGSTTTSTCPDFVQNWCWLSTRTNASGEYAMEVEAGPLRSSYGAPGIGYTYSFAPGYETNVQWVPAGGPLLTHNLQLRPERPIRPGESTSVSVGPTSMLCTDLEDLWVLGNRCEVIRVESAAGTLVVDVGPTGGAAPPLLFWATSGNYAGLITRTGPSTVSIPVRGGTYLLFVGIPEGAPTQRFDVTTSLQ